MIHTLWAAAIVAQKRETTGWAVCAQPVAIRATNREEALGMALERCREVYPIGQYSNHSAQVMKLPESWYTILPLEKE